MRLAIVTPWYGGELIGGAERLAWELSHALARTGAEVDVLATCCRSFLDDWASNYHRSGITRYESGVVLHRFRVDGRDRVAFTRANAALTTIPRIALRPDREMDEALTRNFVDANINSRALLAHLRSKATAYDAVLFVPYLYGPTLAGLPLVADRAFLIPCLHDEAYAYLGPVRDVVAAARGVLFNSLGEEETGSAIYGPGILAKSRVIGHAVAPVEPPRTPVTVGAFAPHRSRYVLYLGRQDASKNIDFLIAAFRAYRERRTASSLQLVLAGPRSASHSADGILDLGPVDERTKAALLTYARALAQPSMHESFSRSLYESWHAHRPVLVHAACRATARAVEDAGGGWAGATIDEWVEMLAAVDESSDESIAALGERGFAAARENGTWDAVARRTLDALHERLDGRPGPPLDQVVPLGDRAIAHYAEALVDALRDTGRAAEVTIAGTQPHADAYRIVHAGGRDGVATGDAYVAHDGAVAVPGRAPVFAVSRAVATVLDARGIAARVLPMPVSPAMWNGVRPEHDRWHDGRTSILSIAPLGAADARRLLDAFVAYLGIAREARLLLFEADCDAAARETLLHEIAELDLQREVVLVGDALPERYAAYRCATLAIALGDGLTVERAVTPLWFDLPVIALAGPVSAEVIEPCGVIVDAFSAPRFAALMRIVATDRALRASIVAEGRRVRARHAPAAAAATLLDYFASTEARQRTLLASAATTMKPHAT